MSWFTSIVNRDIRQYTDPEFVVVGTTGVVAYVRKRNEDSDEDDDGEEEITVLWNGKDTMDGEERLTNLWYKGIWLLHCRSTVGYAVYNADDICRNVLKNVKETFRKVRNRKK